MAAERAPSGIAPGWFSSFRHFYYFIRGPILAPFALSKARPPAYNQSMANGWVSKSVEDKQIDQQEQIRTQEIVDEKERLGRLKAEEIRKIQALKLTRARICEQLSRTTNERYTLLLNTELQQIDSELAKLV